tara:strand:+ start:94 stop:918 length:825 start_codon:yes stop_codon:yes gene_type:complete
MTVILKIDNRERKLIALIKQKIEKDSLDISYVIDKLDLGDFIFEIDGKEKIIIERKSLNDLASSIMDNRYREQSMRLQNYNMHNHNICYLIEGVLEEWVSKIKRITPNTLLSSMFSLQFFKGFSIIRTTDRYDTAQTLISLYKKLCKEHDKDFFYNIEQNAGGKLNSSIDEYTNVISKVKKNNITSGNIDRIVLSQVPGISAITSKMILEKYGSLFKLLTEMNENPNCLDDFTYTFGKGDKLRERHLSQTAIKNIYSYLIEGKVKVININTENK